MEERHQGNEGMVLAGRDVDDVQHLAAIGADIGVGKLHALGNARGSPRVLKKDKIVLR